MSNDTSISPEEVTGVMAELGIAAASAAQQLSFASSEQKHTALLAMAESVLKNRTEILEANAIDMAAGQEKGLSDSFMDRLRLDESRVEGIRDGIVAIAELDDPVGAVISQWDRPNGLQIERVRTPLGVVGVIFESRPNVTADAGALCLKAGNAVILRGGSDSFHSSTALHKCLLEGLTAADLPAACVQIVPTTDRAAVGEMLKGLNGNIDVIIPRGGKGLVGRIQSEARVPVFAHLEGLCHIYVDSSADLNMAIEVVLNS